LPSMSVINSYLGTKKTVVYVGLVVGMSTLTGFAFGAFFS
ncbi:MAG: permease, partial [Chlorobiales bacterium]|nr:permease [Chlorobiales bacterium]